MGVNHTIIPKNFEEEINSPMTKIVGKQPSKKKPNVFGNAISKFFCVKDYFKKDDVQEMCFFARA
jgi:hypothetical protein